MVKNENWNKIIRNQSKFELFILIQNIKEYRDLLFLFVRRDFVAQYKQTILGPLWFFIQPILSTLTFTIIFGSIAKISTDGIPHAIFSLSGVVLWNYFSDCFTKTSDTFLDNANIFGKVYFPRIIVPLSIVISNLIKLSVQLLLFFIIYGYYLLNSLVIIPNYFCLLLPILVILMGGLGLGFGLLFTSLTTKYRDLKFLLVFGIQLMMYASPIVYPLSIVPDKYKIFLILNPVTSIIETFKYGFLGQGVFEWLYLAYSMVFTLLILIIGLYSFKAMERSFMDTI